MGAYYGDKPLTLYYGDHRPLTRYYNSYRLAGWEWQEQTGTDMPFEDTYNDRVEFEALGRSKQASVIANPQLLQFPSSYIPTANVGRLEIVSIQGHKITLRSLTTDASHRYLYAALPMTLKAETYSFRYAFQVVSGSPIGSTGRIRIMNTSLSTEYANITSKTDFSFTPPAAGNYALVLYLAWDALLSSEVVASFDLVVISASEASVNSPSTDYPSPIIPANGDLVVEGRNLCPGTINKINVPYNQGSNTIIVWPSFPYGSGMYIVSCFLDATNAPTGDLRIQYELYADNGTTIEETDYTSRSYSQAPGRVSRVFTAIKGRRVRLFVTRASALPANTLITAKDAMLECGPVAHPYTPYRPIITHALPELRAIPDGAGGWVARDREYIARVGGEWHLMRRQRVGHRVFSGTEDWQGYGNYYGFYLTWVLDGSRNRVRGFCSHLPVTTTNLPAGNLQAWLGVQNAVVYLCGLYTPLGISTVAEFKAILAAAYAAGHPWYIDFPLATPITTDLGRIDLPSYYPYTRVLVEGEYAPDVTTTCKTMEV